MTTTSTPTVAGLPVQQAQGWPPGVVQAVCPPCGWVSPPHLDVPSGLRLLRNDALDHHCTTHPEGDHQP